MPQKIGSTQRQRLKAKDGVILERQYMYLTREVWDKLENLATERDMTLTQVLSLIANTGAKDIQHDIQNNSNGASESIE